MDDLEEKISQINEMISRLMSKVDTPQVVHHLPPDTNITMGEGPAMVDLTRQNQPMVSQTVFQANSTGSDNLQQVYVHHITQLSPPKFDGDTSEAIAWLIDFQEIAAINKWTEEDSINHVRQALTNAAKAWFRSIWYLSKPNSWRDFEREFKSAFLRNDSSDSLRAKLRKLRQTKDMNPMTYYFQTMELCTMVDRKMSDRERIDQVIDNLQPEIRSAIRMKDPQTVIELQRAMKLWVADHPHEKKEQSQPYQARERHQGQAKDRATSRISKENFWCPNCGRKGHYTRECSQPYNHEVVIRRQEEWRANPPFRRKEDSIRQKAHAADVKRSSELIANSSQEAEEQIPFEESKPQVGAIKPRQTLYGMTATREQKQRPSCITCRINGMLVQAVLDTGATLSVVPYDLIKATKTPIHRWTGQSLSLANGGVQQPLGWSNISIDYQDRIYNVDAVVLKDAPDILLGEDYISESRLLISYADGMITYRDKYLIAATSYIQRIEPKKAMKSISSQTNEVTNEKKHGAKKAQAYYVEYIEDKPKAYYAEVKKSSELCEQARLVRARDDILLPPRSRARIEVTISGPESKEPLIFEQQANSTLFVIPGIGRKSQHVLDVVNTLDEPRQILKKEIIAQAVSLDTREIEKPEGYTN